MPSPTPTWRLLALLAILFGLSACDKEPATPEAAVASPTPGPWALPAPPPKSAYQGPLFSLSHDYPTQPVAPPKSPPWQQAIGFGQINTGNAAAYVQAAKDYIAKDMQRLLFDYPNWDPAKAGWYNMPWLASIRDPIRGTYVGSSFPPEMFPVSGLKTNMTTHVAVYYDSVAAYSLRRVWGDSAMDPEPGIRAGGAQFPEGGIIVKPAYTTADASTWAPLQGAYPTKIWATPSGKKAPELMDVQLFQFDIIIKDTQSVPGSGWVFATLVYDKDAPGSTPWEKMIPLGVQWGNDPGVLSPQGCDYLKPGGCPPLAETWINPAAPVYAKETLGWGGRLSGPNDGSVDLDVVVQTANGLELRPGRYAMSSCMGCHGAAEYTMQSFLLPVPSSCSDDGCKPTLASCSGSQCKVDPKNGTKMVYYDTASPDFMRWFQDRPGTVPMDSHAPDGSPVTALDYGMNYAFKALPQWYQATHGKQLNFVAEFNLYRGTPHH